MATLVKICIIPFVFGVIIGSVVTLFIISIGENNRKHDFYQEGFIDGYNEGKEK